MGLSIANAGFILLILGLWNASEGTTPATQPMTAVTAILPGLEGEDEPALSTEIAASSSTLPQIESTDDGEVTTAELGWEWQAISWSWWVILQTLVAIFGIVGNLLVIVVLFVRRERSRSTDTLIGALAAADFLTSVFMIPLPSPARVPQTHLGEAYCKTLFIPIMFWVSIDASIFTLTVIPVERYVAIVYPFHFKRWVTRRAVIMCVLIIWVVSLLANTFVPFIASVNPATSHCTTAYSSQKAQLATACTLFSALFAIPALVMLILQALTARALHVQSRINFGADNHSQSKPTSRHNIAKWRVIQMLFIVVLMFIICLGPSNIMYLSMDIGIVSKEFINSPLDRVLVILGFCNSCANPVIYTARYPQFRIALKELFTSTTRSSSSVFEEQTESKALSSTVTEEA